MGWEVRGAEGLHALPGDGLSGEAAGGSQQFRIRLTGKLFVPNQYLIDAVELRVRPHPGDRTMRRWLIATALATLLPIQFVAAQPGPRRWLAGAAGIGATQTTSGSLYQDSGRWLVRLGGGLRATDRLAVEAGVDLAAGWGYPLFSCELSSTACPVRFNLASLSGDVALSLGPPDHRSRLRVLIGPGLYHLVSKEPAPTLSPATALGINVGLQRRLVSWLHGDVAAIGQAVVLPQVNGGSLWMFQVGLGARVF